MAKPKPSPPPAIANAHKPNELHPILLHVSGLSPFQREASSARVNMFSSSHISQALVVKGANLRRTLTGVERKFAGTTFKIRMPCNGTILKLFEKYPTGVAYGAIQANPITYVIYEDNETREIGILELPKFHCLHQYFGFRYKYTPAIHRLFVGATIPKDTILADSPSVTPDGDYCYGVDTNIAYMSIPQIIEDGVVVSRSYLKKLESMGFETMVESWGKEWYPLNLYGDDNTYKPFPDIGDCIGEDGILMAMRRHDDMLGPVEMTKAALRKPDHAYDRIIYATPGAKVIDVTIKHEKRMSPPPTPVGMEEQTSKYYRAHMNTLRDIVRHYEELKRARVRDGIRTTHQYHNFIVESMIDLDDSGKDKSVHMYRRIPLDDWRVEITFEYDVKPTETFKVTDLLGGKGVICAVWEDDDMPVDQWGNRAEIIMGGEATWNRENPGRFSEQLINAASRDVTLRVREMMAESKGKRVREAFDYLLSYYNAVSPAMYAMISSTKEKPYSYREVLSPKGEMMKVPVYYQGTPEIHVASVVKDGIYLHLPTDNQMPATQVIRNIKEHFPVPVGPVTYRGSSGRKVTTKSPVLIGSVYILLLEKTGNDWSAVSSAKLQHFGMPGKLTNSDKHTAPGRNHPVRLLGEDEVRLFCSTVGPTATAELLEMSNNPALHKHIIANIYSSDKPTAQENCVDRNQIALGNSRPRLFIQHMLATAGLEFAFKPVNQTSDAVYTDNTPTTEELGIIDSHYKDDTEDLGDLSVPDETGRP